MLLSTEKSGIVEGVGGFATVVSLIGFSDDAKDTTLGDEGVDLAAV